jgi:membrane-associated phospholipid phosphatase
MSHQIALRFCRHPWRILVPLLVLTVPVRATDFVRARLDGLTDTGNIMAYVLPVTALGLTAFHKDGEGALEVGESVTISMAITFGLKYSIHSTRPTGDPHSFPSGHATITFSSAEFMRKRYGWTFGAPAYLLASFVGYSRVRAHVHYFRDVAAGAAIGIGTAYFMSSSYHGWQIQPEWSARRRGIMLSREF